MEATLKTASIALVIALLVAACSPSSDLELSELAAQGRDIAQGGGCAACHGADGEGGVGPAWVGLFGSTVELESGETAIADEQYLRVAIVEPEAQVVAGSTITMPTTILSDEDVAALVEYIKELK